MTQVRSEECYRRMAEQIPSHMMEGLRNYLEHGIPPGSFLTAVLENDFVNAVGQADHINRNSLFAWASVLWNELPENAWGSPAKVKDWMERARLRKAMELK